MTRVEAPAAVWGVGLVGDRAWPVSPTDIADETDTAVELLRLLGISDGGLVLIVSRLAETIHVAPLEHAVGRLSARWSSADATSGDAFRTASLVRQLAPDAVIGVNAAVLEALPDADAVFVDVPCVAVTDDVARRALPASRWWLRLGPTNAFECASRTGAHFDGARWRVDRESSGLTVTNLVPRHTPANALPVGFDGAVLDGPCSCGSSWPRVVRA